MKTNEDIIKAMNTNELSEFLCGISSEPEDGCEKCIATDYCYVGHTGFKYWLKMKSEDEDAAD